MKIKKAWITGRPNGQGYLASVTFDIEFQGGYVFQFAGMRLIETKEHKVILVMPNVKDSRGNWKTIFSPLNQMTREKMEGAAIDAWSKLWPNPEIRDMLDAL